MQEALIRDLDKASTYFEPVLRGSKQYYPQLCYYADAMYKKGDYLRAVEIGLELDQRARQDTSLGGRLPSMPLEVVAKSYRALIKDYKKRKENDQAVFLLQRLIALGVASDNDKKMLEKLTNG